MDRRLIICYLAIPLMGCGFTKSTNYVDEITAYIKNIEISEDSIAYYVKNDINVINIDENNGSFSVTIEYPDIEVCSDTVQNDAGLRRELENVETDLEKAEIIETGIKAYLSSDNYVSTSDVIEFSKIGDIWDDNESVKNLCESFNELNVNVDNNFTEESLKELKTININESFVYKSGRSKIHVNNIRIYRNNEALSKISELSSLNNINSTNIIFLEYDVTNLGTKDIEVLNHFSLCDLDRKIKYNKDFDIVGLNESAVCKSRETITLNTVLAGPATSSLVFSDESISNNFIIMEN